MGIFIFGSQQVASGGRASLGSLQPAKGWLQLSAPHFQCRKSLPPKWLPCGSDQILPVTWLCSPPDYLQVEKRNVHSLPQNHRQRLLPSTQDGGGPGEKSHVNRYTNYAAADKIQWALTALSADGAGI